MTRYIQPKHVKTEYDIQAEAFLEKHAIQFEHSEPCARDSFRPPDKCYHYEVTPSKPGKSVSFPFQASINDYHNGIRRLRLYDVLSCLSVDVSIDGTFEDFCADFGYNTDSRSALDLYLKCQEQSSKLRRFFTAQEINDLEEIR